MKFKKKIELSQKIKHYLLILNQLKNYRVYMNILYLIQIVIIIMILMIEMNNYLIKPQGI